MRSDPASRDHERRVGRRFAVPARAAILLSGGRLLQGETVDISAAGVCVTVADPLPLGSTHLLQVELPPRFEALRLSCRVCFCLEREGLYRIGFHCADLAHAITGERFRSKEDRDPEDT